MHLDLLRSFFAVVEHGSLNRAAEQLHVSQSTLTRQMHALEADLGGRLLERGATGVALTAAGHRLHEGMQPVLSQLEAVLGEVRRQARGQSAQVRIGYLVSLATDYLQPALIALRRQHPEVKVTLVDLSPGEQLAALRRGELDIALLGNAGTRVGREFFVRRLATCPVYAVLAASHPLAKAPALRLADLRGEPFIGANDRDLPGHNAWITQLCRRAGFRPRFALNADSLSHGLAAVVAEGAVDLLPEYTRSVAGPGVVYRPLQESGVTWDLCVAWQRGKVTLPMRAVLDALPTRNDPAR